MPRLLPLLLRQRSGLRRLLPSGLTRWVRRPTSLDDAEREELEELRRLQRWTRLMLTASMHDLRGPLAQINAGLAELTASERAAAGERTTAPAPARDLRRGAVAHITAASRSMSSHVRDIDALSRCVDVVDLVDKVETDVADVVRSAVDLVDVGTRRLQLRTEPAIATIDIRRVTQIVDNLVRNAVAHTPDDCTIWVGTTTADDEVVIVVEDSGPGIPPADRERLFLPFVSGRSTGPGVGLSVVAAFTRLHGGHVDVTDRPGGGASFAVHLPRTAQITLP